MSWKLSLICSTLFMLSYCALFGAHARAPTNCTTFECWLASLTLHLPDHNITQDGVTFSMSDITCKDITYSSVDSNTGPYTLSLFVYGLGINCESTLLAINQTEEFSSGHLSARASKSSLSTQVELARDPTTRLVDGLLMHTCNPTITITDLLITGDIKVSDSVKTQIISYIPSGICAEISTVLVADVSSSLRSFHESISLHIDPRPLPFGWIYQDGYFVDLRNNSFMNSIQYIMNSLLGANGMNAVVNHFTASTGRIAVSNITKATHSIDIKGGNVTIGVKSLNVSGANTWTDFELELLDNYTMQIKTMMANLNLSAHIFVRVSTDTQELYEEEILKLNLTNLEFRFQLALVMEGNLLRKLSSNQLTPGCLLNTITNNTQSMLLAFNFETSGVEVLPFGAETQTDQLGLNITNFVVQSYGPAFCAMMNTKVYGYTQIPGYMLAYPADGPYNCTASQGPLDTFDFNATLYAVIGAVSLFLVVSLLALFIDYRRSGVRSEKKSLLDKSKHPGEQGSDALIVCKKIPPFVRLGILLLLFANIAMFISSNTSVGASVYLVITARGVPPIKLPSLFDFSLGNSVKDMWNAGVYPLSVLILVFSGIWPYVKLAMLLMSWLVPGRTLGLKHRERMLLLLDALGKLSLIDSFVMVLMLVAFHFSIVPTVTPLTPDGTMLVQTWVEPHYGLYAFVIATIFSLFLTHAIVRCHRAVIKDDRVSQVDNDDYDKKSVLAYSRRKNNFRSNLLLGLAPLLVGVIAMVAVGDSIPSFEFEFKGAFGFLLMLLDQPTTSSYSVVSLGAFIPSSSDAPHSAGTIFMLVTFFLFVLVAPLIYLLLLIGLLLWPLTLRAQRRLLYATEIAQAWAALEVFILSVIAALLEIRQFAQFIIGDRCDLINKYLDKYAGDVFDGDNRCFDVVASLKSGCWVLFAACLLYLFAGVIVIKCCHRALENRTREAVSRTVNG